MTDSNGDAAPPGWYEAPGDPLGTQRYWDGTQWIGGPQWVPPAPSGSGPNPLAGIGRRLADPGRRIVARILDALIEGIVLAFPIGVWLARSDTDTQKLFENPPWWFTLLALATLLYELAFIALKGATPGKMLMGVEVVGIDGTSPPGWVTAARRLVINAVGLVPGIGGLANIVLTVISFVFLFTDDRRRTLNDRLAPTYVVDVRGRRSTSW